MQAPTRKPVDPALVTFSARADTHPRRKTPRALAVGWMLIAIAALLVFIGVVRAMTERASSTVGPSTPIPIEHKQINTLQANDDTSVETTWQPDPHLVYKCVDKNGVPSYQSMPCRQQAPSAVYEATPDSAQKIASARALERERVQQSRVVSSISGRAGRTGDGYRFSGTDGRDQERANCAAAKAHRTRTLELVGLSRTYDLLHQLDRQVYEACKGLQP